MNEELGCVDIDECIESEENLCEKERNTFCANTPGSYKCMMCDFACEGCTGDGPDHCVKCAKSYVLKDKTCIDATDADEEEGEDDVQYEEPVAESEEPTLPEFTHGDEL
uniref:Uncharacterized protein n=1 Tax=Rhipicephalus zambeziensis TaxID=60191 RepID=A0A224Z1E8_9ACAR